MPDKPAELQDAIAKLLMHIRNEMTVQVQKLERAQKLITEAQTSIILIKETLKDVEKWERDYAESPF